VKSQVLIEQNAGQDFVSVHKGAWRVKVNDVEGQKKMMHDEES
jgi:hypothetical protein